MVHTRLIDAPRTEGCEAIDWQCLPKRKEQIVQPETLELAEELPIREAYISRS
jgi:hypothetical protein